MSTEQDTQSEDVTESRIELLEKLRRLQLRHREVEADKKSAAEDYNDQLKEIKEEIKETLLELEEKE